MQSRGLADIAKGHRDGVASQTLSAHACGQFQARAFRHAVREGVYGDPARAAARFMTTLARVRQRALAAQPQLLLVL